MLGPKFTTKTRNTSGRLFSLVRIGALVNALGCCCLAHNFDPTPRCPEGLLSFKKCKLRALGDMSRYLGAAHGRIVKNS